MKVTLILLVLGFAGVLQACHTPNQYCQICNLHTMCKTSYYGRTCAGKSITRRPPSQAEKTAILHSHNRLRNKVAKGEETQGNGGSQPNAANMMMMEWDNELAMIAQRAAEQCVFDHDCELCRTLLRDQKGVGQNVAIKIYSQKQTTVEWTELVEAFYLTEVRLMPPHYASSYVHSSLYGHYGQMVWWNSRLVGCGASMYKEGFWFVTLLFCNYRTGANSNGAKVYEVGPPASNCPNGTRASNPAYTGLCVIQGTGSRATFHTDGQLLGLPVGTYTLPGKCERAGFRLYESLPYPHN